MRWVATIGIGVGSLGIAGLATVGRAALSPQAQLAAMGQGKLDAADAERMARLITEPFELALRDHDWEQASELADAVVQADRGVAFVQVGQAGEGAADPLDLPVPAQPGDVLSYVEAGVRVAAVRLRAESGTLVLRIGFR